MVTDTYCAALSFANDFRLLQIQGYYVILGLDWLSQCSTMLVNWEDKWVELYKKDTTRLQVQEERASVQMCEAIQVAKELK
jgi:hypothetical protein